MGFRSFNANNLESIDQRAAKLLAVNVGGLKIESAIRPNPFSTVFKVQEAGSILKVGFALSK